MPELSKSDFCFAVIDGGFEIEDELLGGELFSVNLAHVDLQFVDLLDFARNRRLE